MKFNKLTTTALLLSLLGAIGGQSVVHAESVSVSNTDENEYVGEHKNRSDKMKGLIDRKMKLIDTDNDGLVSVDEYMTFSRQRFEEMDTNNDNFASPEEAKAAAKLHRERQRAARSKLDELEEQE